MKREDVKNKIPGITDEQLNWLMQENGADINREKSAATALQTQLTAAQAQLKTAQDGLAAFDGKKKPEEYEAELAKLQADLKAQADGFAFDNALDTAILGKKGRSVKAVRACWTWTAEGSADRTATSQRRWTKPLRQTPGPLVRTPRHPHPRPVILSCPAAVNRGTCPARRTVSPPHSWTATPV